MNQRVNHRISRVPMRNQKFPTVGSLWTEVHFFCKFVSRLTDRPSFFLDLGRGSSPPNLKPYWVNSLPERREYPVVVVFTCYTFLHCLIVFLSLQLLLLLLLFAQKCKVIYERDPKSHARYITFANSLTKDSHNAGNFMPYSFRMVCGFFNVPHWT